MDRPVVKEVITSGDFNPLDVSVSISADQCRSSSISERDIVHELAFSSLGDHKNFRLTRRPLSPLPGEGVVDTQSRTAFATLTGDGQNFHRNTAPQPLPAELLGKKLLDAVTRNIDSLNSAKTIIEGDMTAEELQALVVKSKSRSRAMEELLADIQQMTRSKPPRKAQP